MKNKWKIALAGASILLLAGCGNQVTNQNQNENQGTAQNQEQQKEQEQNGSGIISSIKDAMSLGKTMRCTYKIGEGNNAIEVVSYIKGDKFAMEMSMEGQKQRTVNNEDATFSWVEGEKTGTKIARNCFEDDNIKNNSDEDMQSSRAQMQKEFENAVDVKCEPVASADFSVPSGIDFEDQCEMMKNLMKNIPGAMNGQNGAGAPGGALQME